MKKTLLMTGASSDVGVALLQDIVGQYDYIIAHFYGENKSLQEVYDKYKYKMIIIECDFSDIDETEAFISNINEMNYEITDIIHLPAGMFKYTKFNKSSWDDFCVDINISLRSIVLILKNCLPTMAKKKYGRIIVMISHCTCNVPPKFLSSYVTVKYALLGLVKSLAVEFADKNIRINGVSPTMIETKFLANVPELLKESTANSSPTGSNLNVSEVIPIFKFLVSDEGSSITGQNIAITNGNIV